MTKTQNVFTLLKLLQARDTTNASPLAAMLGVDIRTVYRYMRELRAAGYVFKTKSGRRGYILYVGMDRTSGEPYHPTGQGGQQERAD